MAVGNGGGASRDCLIGLSGGVLKGETSSALCPIAGSRAGALNVVTTGVAGFLALLTGGGTLTFANGDGVAGLRASASWMIFARGGVMERIKGAVGEAAEPWDRSRLVRGGDWNEKDFVASPKIGFGGDTGDCRVTAGGDEGRDHVPIDTGRGCEALPGSNILFCTISVACGAGLFPASLLSADSAGKLHGERRGRSSDVRGLSTSTYV